MYSCDVTLTRCIRCYLHVKQPVYEIGLYGCFLVRKETLSPGLEPASMQSSGNFYKYHANQFEEYSVEYWQWNWPLSAC